MSAKVRHLFSPGSGVKTALVLSPTSILGRYAYRKLKLATDGKSRVSMVMNFTVTPY